MYVGEETSSRYLPVVEAAEKSAASYRLMPPSGLRGGGQVVIQPATSCQTSAESWGKSGRLRCFVTWHSSASGVTAEVCELLVRCQASKAGRLLSLSLTVSVLGRVCLLATAAATAAAAAAAGTGSRLPVIVVLIEPGVAPLANVCTLYPRCCI